MKKELWLLELQQVGWGTKSLWVSDSASVAGTFADSAGGWCTGKGEHIINQKWPLKNVSRLRDNIPLKIESLPN